MQKLLLLLTVSILLLIGFSTTHIQSAAELPAINIEAYKILYMATNNKDIHLAQQALSRGAPINGLPKNGNLTTYHHLSTPLETATKNGDVTMVTFLLEQNADADATNSNETPLLKICQYRNINIPQSIAVAIATELLRHNANINVQDHLIAYTPLMRAIDFLKSEQLVKLLILSGADVSTITNFEGKTALDLIVTPAMHTTVLEACATREQAFQQLPALEAAIRTEVFKNLHIPIEDFAHAFYDAIPYYTDQKESQPAYDLLNEQIAHQWVFIKEKLETTRLLSQPDCLPVQNVTAIVVDYLFQNKK